MQYIQPSNVNLFSKQEAVVSTVSPSQHLPSKHTSGSKPPFAGSY